MKKVASTSVKKSWWPERRVIWILLCLAAVGIFIFANMHLVYVAMKSQPKCVVHSVHADAPSETFRAAKPSCYK